MRFMIVVGFALFGCWALMPAAPVPTHLIRQQPKLYFPTEVGTQWVNSNKDFETNCFIEAAEDRNGHKYVKVIEESPANPIAEWYQVAVSEKGVAMVDCSLGEPDEPFWTLCLPQAAQKKWDVALSLKRSARDGSIGTCLPTGPSGSRCPPGDST